MNTSDFSTMYHVNPVVSELNKVPGFDPLKHVRATKDGLKLDLPYKKLWFRLKYPNGIIRPLLVKMTDQLAIIEARVFFDRRDSEPAASFIAQCRKSDSELGDYVKAAQNSAIDQALTDAGFGVQFVPAEEEIVVKTEELPKKPAEQSETPPVQEKRPVSEKTAESGQPIQPAVIATNQRQNEISAVETSQESVAPEIPKAKLEEILPKDHAAEITSVPAYTEDMTVEDICSLMSLEDAQNYVVKEGACSGWTLAQVADRRPASLKFYMNGYQGKDNILRAAAWIISQKMAA